MRLLLIAIAVPLVVATATENISPFKSAHQWIEEVNNDPESTWTAGQNFDPELPASYMKKLLGLKMRTNRPSVLSKAEPITDIDDEDIPESFDARKKWKECKSLQKPRDQGNCGSCWAVAAAATFSDRLCIATKGKFNGHLSSIELVSCCSHCGDGCDGGEDDLAWDYFKYHGIVTGGDYNSTEGCQPYPLQACEHHVKGPRPSCPSLDPTKTPKCKLTCTNKFYKKPFQRDHYKVKKAYFLPSRNVKAVQKEIMKYGPVEAGFEVFDDFLSYKKGVYQPNKKSRYGGGHAVKIIGWGVQKKTPYWLVQNSWNSDWGDKGLFKILRGKNVCGFESNINAGRV